MLGASTRRAVGRTVFEPTLRGIMDTNANVMHETAMFANDETFQNSRMLDFRRKGALPPSKTEQMTLRRLQFGCTSGRS